MYMKSFAWLPIASGMLVLVLSLGLAFLTVSKRDNAGEVATTQNIQSEAKIEMPSLVLSPVSGKMEFVKGMEVPVGIILDTAGKSVDGVDVVVSFDPAKAQVIGGKVNATNLFQEVPLNKVDNVKGKIKFSALTFDPKPLTGVVGTFSFRPVSSGEVNFQIDFTPGATTDSNIAEHGRATDVLGEAGNATFTFN